MHGLAGSKRICLLVLTNFLTCIYYVWYGWNSFLSDFYKIIIMNNLYLFDKKIFYILTFG